jgi:Ni,Fe-hydrogenase III large subunit/Ni,Fe-hydrogenase III component G
MKIDNIKDKLESLNYDLNVKIKNNNELYVMVSKDRVKEVVSLFIKQFKLNFISEFCRQESSYIISCLFSNSKKGYYVLLSYTTERELVSLQDLIYPSYLFEREIADLYGIKIINGKDVRNLVKHECWQKDVFPLRKEFQHGDKIKMLNEIPDYDFERVSGDDGYQIAVGPVHAGIIEPGHFRFTVMGEPIENLEIRLMYKHRGIEKLCENMDAKLINLIFERVSGESSVAYSEAYAQLVEKLMNIYPRREIKALRVVLLELERIYNFLDDLSGICQDVGFSYPAKQFGYFSEYIHQLCERITGSRFMRNVIVPLGINIDFDEYKKLDIINSLQNIKSRIDEVIMSTLTSVSFLDRVENTGKIYRSTAKKLCLTGIAGRASGLKYDVRVRFPYEVYKEIKKDANIEIKGCVYERYKLKILELRDAFNFIEKALSMIDNDIKREKPAINLIEGSEAIAAVETVKGELVVYSKVAKDNKFNRIYFKTPSFTNWEGLTKAVLGEIVPDFPLCNKSFNMSYSENDR